MTNKKLISEILSAHADQLLKRQKSGEDYAQLFPENQDLPPLLNLADHVKSVLEPMTPPQSFKQQLQKELIAAARMKQLNQEFVPSNLPQPSIPLLVSAVAGILLALSGLVWVLWRQQKPTTKLTA